MRMGKRKSIYKVTYKKRAVLITDPQKIVDMVTAPGVKAYIICMGKNNDGTEHMTIEFDAIPDLKTTSKNGK